MTVLPTNIITQITQRDQAPPLKQAYIVAVDLAPEEEDGGKKAPPWLKAGIDAIAFQYWPDGISDNRTSEWNPRMIPGGSHPIYQWSHGGERVISMTAVFTNDIMPEITDDDHGGGLLSDIGGAINAAADVLGLGVESPDKSRVVPVESALSWLRYFTYPLYGSDDLRVFEPPKCELVLPNSGISYDGGDSITCVMTSNQITYEAFFTNGKPRIAEVTLEFSEVVQRDGKITFHSRDAMGLSAPIGSFLGLKVDSPGGGLLDKALDAIGF